MMEFSYLIIICCLAFASFLLYKEIRRRDKSRLLWRIVASMLMVGAFVFLMFPVRYNTKKNEPIHELNLLTEGASLEAIKALKANVYTLDSSVFLVNKKKKITYLADLTYHLKTHPDIRKINIYGYGLAEQELKTLADYQIYFHPAVIPTGILSVSWPKKLNISETFIIQGKFHNPTEKKIKLKLYGMGRSLDSLTVKTKGMNNFSFSTQPKHIGRAVFKLIALQGNDTLSIDPVPFEIVSEKPISVLILASFPDFEYKFLKQWLYENHYPVAFRSQISKNKYSTDFLNRKPVNLNRLNSPWLKDIDLVIIDEDELRSLSLSDRATVYREVSNGMGLIIKAAKTGLGEQPLISDSTGKTMVSIKLSGMGKILTTTQSSTYQWQLVGNQMRYAKFWSHLFEKASRKEIPFYSFEVTPKWPSVYEKSTIKINLNDYKPPLVLIDSIPISPRQNMELPFLWDGYFWAAKPGWSTVSINRKVTYLYHYKRTDWKAAKNFAKLNSTVNYEARQRNSVVNFDEVELHAEEEISKWWFFGIFLLSISYLWYEQRFLANK
ncbi:hypothetical protein [Pedobacter insulae]|uniref:Uncharacterized protein n=1 Tax=Pedobacter insulae TaxID=414048 RepID=A0A1I2Y4F8_9SPHI|nr:hypothetical protein [Pedobacter insulae]SFH19211.1 hypothetical protein SAMN04489864_106154 [Pedobacter insulae]